MAVAPSSLEGDESNFAEPSRGIDCPLSVLHSIRTAVLERFNSTPHGGDEVTGVLFGTRTGEDVRITAFCPVEGESALSRARALTEAQQSVTAVIAAARSHEELAGLEPLGWFRAHPRCDLKLTERDLEIANTLFPQPWQVGLLMRPGNSAETRSHFYWREAESVWTAACAMREFTLPAAELQPGVDLEPTPGEAVETQLSTDVWEPEPPAELGSFPDLTPKGRTVLQRPPLRWALALIAVVVLASGIYWFTRPQGLALGLSDSGGQLRIAWDPKARPVRNGKAGHLEIVDGGQKIWMELDPEQLRVGNVTCARRSNDVTVRLVVEPRSGAPVEEMARFAGWGAPPRAAAGNREAGGNAPAQPENPPELVVPVPVEHSAPETLAQDRPKFQEPRTEANRTAPVVTAPPPDLAPPVQMARSAPATVAAPPVVRAEPPAEKPVAPRTVSATSTAAVPRAPASGRVIWIGRLQKNQPVTISGKNCSVGTITGELPARAFRFSVSPGDLSSDGIVLYTSNMQYANSVVEPPGAENGWNKTVYTWNPKYANDVSVDEAPAAQNGWNRITLRSRNPKISVIVIDWTALN